ncbi:small multi-drug export protein [Intestinibacillus massiliensis]|uniref:COG2426 family protein n=1 Tax=Intestinibacillus massiliensis TaxID=1871029 RepID=UPI000B359EF1|nr:small multi-drug export protein [Intestinibacillus massiliensis]MCB6365056.1 small multi-drug export protein [Intestinibacillus massiliensis]
MQAFFDWLLGAGREVAVFIISMVPLVELRGAVPLGTAIGMPWVQVLLIALAGNILPIPFILLFAEKLLDWLATLRPFAGFANWYKNKLLHKTDRVTRYANIGLFLFVAIPLPGTGAWSGAAIAALLKMPVRKAFFSISLGVITAGIIMTIASQGVALVSGLL